MEIPSNVALAAQNNMDSDPTAAEMVAGSNEVSPVIISRSSPVLSPPGHWPICRPLGVLCAIATAMAFLCSLFFSDTHCHSISFCPRALAAVCSHTYADPSEYLHIPPYLFPPTYLARPPERLAFSASAQWHTAFSHLRLLTAVRTPTCANVSPDLLALSPNLRISFVKSHRSIGAPHDFFCLQDLGTVSKSICYLGATSLIQDRR